MVRRILVYTGSRAEYSLLYPVAQAIEERGDAHLELVVGGSHFASTIAEIGEEMPRSMYVESPSWQNSLSGSVFALGESIKTIAALLVRTEPDVVVVYGDRREAFAALIASTQLGIATAHIEGGDYTAGGALDDSVRHAMSKLAHIHFTTNKDASDRLVRMGEDARRIVRVGLPAMDAIAAGDYSTAEEVRAHYELPPDAPLVLLVQHSIATDAGSAEEQIVQTLAALTLAHEQYNVQVVAAYPGDDPGHGPIIEALESWAEFYPTWTRLRKTHGRRLWHGLLAIASVLVGNSSAGIKETPAFHVAAVDIGARQRGRTRSVNVLQADYDHVAILGCIERALNDEEFKQRVRYCPNPYAGQDVGANIAEHLATMRIDSALVQKRMMY